jgi:toxin ParE1/3/4
MARVLFDRDAEDDLRPIVRFIGVEQSLPETARIVAGKIERECQRVAKSPLIGQLRDAILPGMRIFSIRPYVVFYFPLDDGIRVLRVIHAARDYPALFQ